MVTLLATLLGCSHAPKTESLENPFGAFNFTLESRPASEQIGLLDEVGYKGVALTWPGVETFEAFATAPAVREGRFRLFAVLYDFRFDTPWSREEVDTMLSTLAPQRTDLWLMLSGPHGPNESMVTAVRELVAMATARGVRVVLYPHDDNAIENVEEAVALLQAVGRPELKVSLHLCHELKAGNRDRLAEVIAAAAPHLVLASIHGAARETVTPGWSTTIQPLDRGDLDVRSAYLLPLIRAGYTGPVLLHTFGLVDPPEEHLRRSYEAWKQMAGEVAATLASER
ncbi:sugar phosphate isomerase/epimerase family protein [Hyalangium rubrum]|uniref:TIM barrel protein n=1 Tax=Hyalangium rubrum TaxID=3103134 RepID=A0ABU5HFN0_9BACT|nr:TIM barrel protein [Hyalangium sp. s54d21]MDY7231967.1 TIM barrel protein [Hyalangium sp. s54d21]